MGTQPATPVRVRVLLPDDTVLRVPVTSVSTTSDLLAYIQQRWIEASYSPEARVDTALPRAPFELVLVRCGLVFHEKQFVQDAGVYDGDILEWRNTESRSEFAIHENERGHRNNGLDEEAETRSSEVDKELNDTGKSTAPWRQKMSKLRQERTRHPVKVGVCRRPSPPSQKESPLRSPPSSFPHRHDALSRFLPRDFLLRVGFEYLDRLASVQLLSRQLLVQIRDIYSRVGPQPIEKLLPIIHSLARETSELIGAEDDAAFSPSVRWLYPLIARSLRGTELPVVMQGYVDVAEWVALWRNQRRVYACLCGGAQLLFFTTQKQCDEFLFERTTRGDETTLIVDRIEELDHKRILKENAPQTSIDLVASQWNVRKGEGRHAFALFDKQGKLRLIMDVSSERETDQWIVAIKKEMSQSELLMTKVVSSPSLVVKNLTVPLRWLHCHVDSLSRGRSRMERVKSWTLTQALKDLRRDRLEINGILYHGLCVEEIVGALLMEITRLAPKLAPADALQFTRLLLVTSSRTQGGGDILDAMHVAVDKAGGSVPHDQYCFCPVEAARSEPIRIDIALDESRELVASIRMEMAYRVFTNVEMSGDGAVMAVEEPSLYHTELREPAEELVLTGRYHRSLVCSGEQWNRLDGSVSITVNDTVHGGD